MNELSNLGILIDLERASKKPLILQPESASGINTNGCRNKKSELLEFQKNKNIDEFEIIST